MDSAITNRRRMIAIISPLPADETTFTFDYTHPQSPCLQGLGSAMTYGVTMKTVPGPGFPPPTVVP